MDKDKIDDRNYEELSVAIELARIRYISGF